MVDIKLFESQHLRRCRLVRRVAPAPVAAPAPHDTDEARSWAHSPDEADGVMHMTTRRTRAT